MAQSNTDVGQIAGIAAQTAGNMAIQAAANKRQYKNQMKAMAQQDAYNRELWDRQNAYNSPTAQMERLKEAGLNPYLMYGGGTASAGNAGPQQAAEFPSQQATRGEIPDLALRRLQIRQADAQYAATVQNTQLARQRAGLVGIQSSIASLKELQEGIRSKNYKALAQAEVDLQKFITLRSGELFANERTKGTLMDQLHEVRSTQLSGIKLDNTFKQNRNDLAKMGIYQHDHPLFRAIIAAAHRMGIDPADLIKQGYDKLKYLIE